MNNKPSDFFKDTKLSTEFLEIIDEEKNKILIIFRNQSELNSKNHHEIIKDRIKDFKEITLIFDYESLAIELDTNELKKFIFNIDNNISKSNQKLNLIIKNTYMNPDKELTPISYDNKLILNKLEISDELYSFSPNLNYLFPNIEVNELILKKFKFNSKEQLSNFFQFIINTKCRTLTLDDIFIELIIQKDENDKEYKDLDIYISYIDGIIVLDNIYTSINSLTLRDCPLFAIIGNMFTYNDSKGSIIYKNIDIDQTSLLNPSIITKFKIKDGKYDITFDLDSFKLQLENEDTNEYDYIDYLTYMFNIIISFTSKNQKLKIKEDEDGVGIIDRKRFHKLVFKNFDTTKFEYITDDDITFIEEENWVLSKEEKKKKQKWDNFVDELKNFKYEKLSQVQELVFDNCSYFFIKWILNFIKGKDNKKDDNFNYDFNLLKFKKCANDYVNLKKVLTMKINKLILFDTPLIIGKKFPKKKEKKHLDMIIDNLGTIDILILKINSLESYGKENNLNTIKTYEILVELITNKNFNKQLIFEFNALSSIMTYLAFKEYSKNKKFYYNEEEEETNIDIINEENYKRINEEEKESDKNEDLYLSHTSLPVHMFFNSKKYRDYIYYRAFKLESLNKSEIILKNMTIKKETENFENQNFLIKKYSLQNKVKNQSQNYELQKIDFGSDGFNIDRDYKYFFSINNIKTVVLINVCFSNFKDPILKQKENETIINLISTNRFEQESINKNKYSDIKIPNYKIDTKTLNSFLFKNFLFENIGMMFQYFLLRIEPQYKEETEASPDSIEKKVTLSDYFTKYKSIFDCFKEEVGELTIIINSIKELKELYCTLCVLLILNNQKNNFINEYLFSKSNKNTKFKINLPDKNIIEKKLQNYFLKEENEEEKQVYSEMNYYYTSKGEENLFKNKKIDIGKYTFHIEYNFKNDYETL